MTFDLFAEAEPVAPPAPAAPPRAEVTAYPMEPVGVNRWRYKGEIIVFDNRRALGSPLGRWRTVEGIGLPVLHSDDRTEVCRAIDQRIGSEVLP